MIEKIAKIESTFLGYEGHGIFTAILQFNYGGSGQGTPAYHLGGDTGGQFIEGLINAAGVDSWEDIKGRTVMALLDKEGFSGTVIGIKPLPTEKGEQFLFSDWSKDAQND